MNFLKNIFGKKDEPIRTYEDFWKWFQHSERVFYTVVKDHGNIEKDFFDKLSPKLAELNDGIFFLAGMYDENTVELVLTADGSIKHIVFVEELVNSAPGIPGWKFTALKPALDIEHMGIEMAGYKFNNENLHFFANHLPGYPDEIDITIIHEELNEDNRITITNGIEIFLDNYLGELNFVTTVDAITVMSRQDAIEELIPIAKLKDFLTWREKEFIEKYEGLRHDTSNDNYSILEATLESGNSLIATINTGLLNWDSKASHPWILTVEIKYDGTGNNGMPDNESYALMNNIEEEIMEELKDMDGYLNIGRQTANNMREIYFACREFRKPSKVLFTIQQKYAENTELAFEIYKDKYWRTFNRFAKTVE